MDLWGCGDDGRASFWVCVAAVVASWGVVQVLPQCGVLVAMG